mmetsp:Transcript_29062/g.46705  ORF Transcript_29062/g.46705 Transcript_29062/m.46705 type:complete len:83 (+) Transcript_29062:959-1207(+)
MVPYGKTKPYKDRSYRHQQEYHPGDAVGVIINARFKIRGDKEIGVKSTHQQHKGSVRIEYRSPEVFPLFNKQVLYYVNSDEL